MGFTPPPKLKAGMFGTRGPAGMPNPTGVTKPAKPKGPSGIRIERRIGIQAPAEVIWDVIYDLERWHEWNPLYPRAEGKISLGKPLDLTLALPGQPPRQIQPVVLEWVPNEQLHWRLSLMGGLVRSIRFIEIDPLSETGCIVNNGELFQGLMAKTVLRRIGRSIHRGFAGMNEALKARAEAEWEKRQAQPAN